MTVWTQRELWVTARAVFWAAVAIYCVRLVVGFLGAIR